MILKTVIHIVFNGTMPVLFQCCAGLSHHCNTEKGESWERKEKEKKEDEIHSKGF